MHRTSAWSVSLCLLAASFAAHAQSVVVLPGSSSNGQALQVYGGTTLTPTSGVSAGSGAFEVLALPDGSRYYVISGSTNGTVTAVDSTFSNAAIIANLSQGATAAVLTPDGSKLIVAAGNVYIINTAAEADLTPNGAITNLNGHVIDLAVSLDGSTLFALSLNNTSGSELTAINLSTEQIIKTVAVQGIATAVTVGPDDYVYVSTQNQILQIDPNSVTATTKGVLAVNGYPGKLVFSTDGKYALAPNEASTGAVILFDLTKGTASTVLPVGGVPLTTIVATAGDSFYGYSSSTQGVYVLSITTASSGTSVSIAPLSISGITATQFSGIAVSGEIASGSNGAPDYLYLMSGTTLYSIERANNQVTQATLTNAGSALQTVAPTETGGTPASLLLYGNDQTIAAGAKTAPLVVRVLDSTGHPIGGVGVTFATNNNLGTLTNTSVVTGGNGYAITYLTAPVAGGLLTVKATSGTLTASFTVTSGSASTGTGTGSNGTITAVAGNGQVVYEFVNTGTVGGGFGSPLVALVTDANGNPAPNVPVTFTITAGPGTLTASLLGGATLTPNGQGVIVNTDKNGEASLPFLSSSVPFGESYVQTTVTATSTVGTATYYITTVSQENPPTVTPLKPSPGLILTGQAGTTQTGALQVQVVSSSGLGIPNVSLTLNNSVTGGPALTCANGTPLTDSTGTATCDLLFGGRVGSGVATPVVGTTYTTRVIQFQVTVGPPAAIKIVQGNNQTGNAGQKLTQAIKVQVSDAIGDLLVGVPVTFTVSPTGAATLSSVSATTDGSGYASAFVTLGSIGGAVQITVAAAGITQTFTETANIPVSTVTVVSGGSQSVAQNGQFPAPLVVSVTDANGNPVQGDQVTFAVTSGTATLGSATATTDVNGQASTTVTAGATVGTVTVTATVNGVSTAFTLTIIPPGPSNLAIVNGASFQPGISPGAIATITGTGLTPGVTGTVSANMILGPLPTALDGISVTFNGTPAPIYYVSNVNGQEQVAVQVPYEVQPGTTTVTVNTPGGGTGSTTVQVLPASPGVFQYTTGNGTSYAVATHPDGTYVTSANPAKPGEVVTIFATGLGQTTPALTTGSAGIAGQTVTGTIVVGLYNAGVPLISAETVPGLVGVYALSLQVPANGTAGDIPLGLIVPVNGTSYFAASTFIPVAAP